MRRAYRYLVDYRWTWRSIPRLILLVAGMAGANVYHVDTAGVDAADRDGSADAPWRTLAYSVSKVPQGDHEIKLGPGLFVESRTSYPESGLTITGAGAEGDDATIIQAASDWSLDGTPHDENYTNYLIAVDSWAMSRSSRAGDFTIRGIQFRSPEDALIDGALYFKDCDNVTVYDCVFEDFKWTAMYFAYDNNVHVHDCFIKNANVVEDRHWSGNIKTWWVRHSEFNNITSRNTIHKNWGVGYKGSGHENTKIHHCSFIGEGFSIEIPFDAEYGVEIYQCTLSSPISVPLPDQTRDPNELGYDYTFWIHHNYMTCSYAVEGPRNHLRISHNFIQITDNVNGRVYSQFGGDTEGPMWVHHNVVENADRSFIWKGSGRLDSVYVYNNTVYLADAGDRAASVLDAWHSEQFGTMDGWEVKNNIFVAAATQRRNFGDTANMDASHNVCLFVENVPGGNFPEQDPGLSLAGEKPFPFYAPAGPSSFVVDRGVEVGFDFVGIAPDIGAFELPAD
ncbi:MAG: hypothetical protein GF344_20875, partial [Chitinivibrionales bacterium]|nr:hypothetical protein [Chitinivibrionales bacterium]MBD3359048.1 hypothetical protein [Chitinivibrionales bacterium]